MRGPHTDSDQEIAIKKEIRYLSFATAQLPHDDP